MRIRVWLEPSIPNHKNVVCWNSKHQEDNHQMQWTNVVYSHEKFVNDKCYREREKNLCHRECTDKKWFDMYEHIQVYHPSCKSWPENVSNKLPIKCSIIVWPSKSMNFNAGVFFLLHLSQLIIKWDLPVGNLELLSFLPISHVTEPYPVQVNRSSHCKNHPDHLSLSLFSIELFRKKRHCVLE